MNNVVVDASLWVAHLVPQDAFHVTVRNWMAARLDEGTGFVAPSILLLEVAGAISRRTGDPYLAHRAIEHLQRISELRIVGMGRALIDVATHLAAELGLRGADAAYVAVAYRLNLPLYTLDIDQRERAELLINIPPID